MKKVLSLLVLAVICVSLFVGCASSAGTAADSGLTAAKDYLYAMYRNKKTVTPSDFQRVGVVTISGTAYTVNWNAVVTSGAADSVAVIADGNMVTIDVNDKTSEDVKYTLTATISDAEGNSEELAYEYSIPKFKELTWAEYVESAKDSTVVVKGVVTGTIAKSKGNSSNALYMQDADGGYYVYNMAEDPVTESGIKEGMTVRVTGLRDTYSGTYEIMNAVVEILDDSSKMPEPVDFTAKFAAAESLKDADLVAQQAMLVTLKDVEISSQNVSSGYYNFKLNGKETYLRISSSVCPITKADQAELIKNHADHLGWTADVTGVICVYDGAFYLSPVSKDAFLYKSLPAKDDAGMIAFELDNLSVQEAVVEDSVLNLATEGAGYSQVKISWASDNACAVVDGSKLAITLPETEAKVSLTATVQSGNATQTKVFTINVDAAATDLYIATPVSQPEVGVAYKYALNQGNLGKTLYFTGEMNGKYLATSDKADKAVDVQIEEADGGFRLFFADGDAKTYVEIYEYAAGKAGVHLTAEPVSVFTWNTELGIFVADVAGAQYYLGTYKTYDTISASKTSYINAENKGVSQFPVELALLSNALYKVEEVSEVKAGQPYNCALVQANLGETLYFTGEMNGKYLAASNKVEKAVEIQIEEVEGGFRLFFADGDAKTYVEIYEYAAGKAGVHLTAEPVSVFTWNTELGIFVADVAGAQYYLGTYKTYDTISASKTSYINAENKGVSQFPLMLCQVSLVPVERVAALNPQEGVAYKVALVQNNIGKTLYLNGSMNGKYLGTTDKLSKAADVFVEKSDAGFRAFIMDGDVKTYAEIYEYAAGKAGVHYTTEPTTVFTWNAELKIPVTDIAGTAYYLGTYKTYDTISASKTSYINAENKGVSQFPVELFTIEFVK